MNKLVFGNTEFDNKSSEVSKKQFYESKTAMKFSEVDVSKIVVSHRVKGNNDTDKIFIGYIYNTDSIARPLCSLLPQMSGWIKYFENSGKNMIFKIEDDEVYLKYNEIWNKIKKLLDGIKLSSEPIYNDSYIKTKVKTFSDVTKNCLMVVKYLNKMVENACIPCISIDNILKVNKNIIHRFI